MATAPKLPDVVFDLDAETRAPDEIKEPFTTKVQGRVITMIDPEEFDWQDLAEARLSRGPRRLVGRVAVAITGRSVGASILSIPPLMPQAPEQARGTHRRAAHNP